MEQAEYESLSETSMKLMREELEDFLVASRGLQSSDGSGPLLLFPPSFDSISSAMTREDLHLDGRSDDEWSRQLLSDRFDQETDSKSFERGRYRGLFETGYGMSKGGADDPRLARGLAEISLLDRQLVAVSRKARMAERGESEAEGPETFITRTAYGGSRKSEPMGAQEDRDADDDDADAEYRSKQYGRGLVTTDDVRLELLMSEPAEDLTNQSRGLSGSESYRRLLSAKEMTRLRDIDDKLAVFAGPTPAPPAPGEVLLADQRLSTVRREYSRAIDAALALQWGGAFAPYLKPISLSHRDLLALSESCASSNAGQTVEAPMKSSISSIRLGKLITRNDVNQLLDSLPESSSNEEELYRSRVHQLLSMLREEVQDLVALRNSN